MYIPVGKVGGARVGHGFFGYLMEVVVLHYLL